MMIVYWDTRHWSWTTIKKLARLGVAFVHPKVRGKGFLQDLTLKLIENAQLKDLQMIYVTAVCHICSHKKAAAKFEFKDMAHELVCGSELNMKGINEISDHRESFVIMGRYFLLAPSKNLSSSQASRNYVKNNRSSWFDANLFI